MPSQSPAYAAPDILEGYAQLQQLQQLLLSRDLQAAWSKLRSFSSSQPQVEKAYQSISNMDDILRRSLAREVLQPLFKSVDTTRFEAWLGAEGKAQQVASSLGEGWSVEGAHVKVPEPAEGAMAGRKDLEDGFKAGKEGLNLQSPFFLNLIRCDPPFAAR